MEEIEDANPGSNARDGWLNRLIGIDAIDSPLQAFNLAGGVPPASLYGAQPMVSAGDVDSMSDPRRRRVGPERPSDALPAPAVGQQPHGHGQGDAVDVPGGQGLPAGPGHPEDTEERRAYPDNDLGRALAEVARIVRGDVGVEVVTVDQGDWDHHPASAPSSGAD